MGNNQSQKKPGPIPIDCNCERVMPEVIKACCGSVNDGVENTFATAVNSMLGPNAKLVTNVLNENDWKTTYSNYVENIVTAKANNIEPFVAPTEQDLKNLTYCNCDWAAYQAIVKCKEGAEKATDTIADIIDENDDLFDGIANTGVIVGNYAASSNPLKEPQTNEPPNNWITKYFGPTRENYEDIGLYKFVRQSLESRHRAFKDSPQFAEDCKSNATNAIKTFLTAEMNDLNTLYNYYITFTKDHTTLLLDRSSMADTISNKVAMLEQIQRKIDNYKSTLHMDNRKNIYLASNYDIYKNIYFYYIIIYYSLIVLYLIFSKFISEKQYTNKITLLLLFIYLITPIILSYLINIMYEGYIYYLEFYNLKEDTPTYNSIIEKM
jgi:hypothetical protein